MDQTQTQDFTVSLSSQIPTSYSQGTRQHVSISLSHEDMFNMSHSRPQSRQQQDVITSHESNRQDFSSNIHHGLLNKNAASPFPVFQTENYSHLHSTQHDQLQSMSKQADLSGQSSQRSLEYSHRNSPIDIKYPVTTAQGVHYSPSQSASLKQTYTTSQNQQQHKNPQSEAEKQDFNKGNYNKESHKHVEMFYEHEIKKDSEIKLTNSDIQYLANVENQSNLYARDVTSQSNVGENSPPTDATVSHLSETKPSISLSEQTNLTLHLPSNRTHVCLTCYKTFKNKPQLSQHELVHNGMRKHVCMYCDKAFKQICHLNQHTRVHTGERPYKCSIDGCGRAFAQLSNLNHHMKNHEDHVKRDVSKQFRCEVCDRSYANQNSLHTHIQKLHMNLKAAEGSTSHPIVISSQTKKRKKKNKQQMNLLSDVASMAAQEAGQQYVSHFSESEDEGLASQVRSQSQIGLKDETMTTKDLNDNKNHTGHKVSLPVPMEQLHGLPFPEKQLQDLQHFTLIKTEPVPPRHLDRGQHGLDNGETQLSQTYSPGHTPPGSTKQENMQSDVHPSFHHQLQRDITSANNTTTTTTNGSHISNSHLPFLIHSSPGITSPPIPSTLFSSLPPLSLPQSVADSLPSHIRHHFSNVLAGSHTERDWRSATAQNFFHPAFSDQTSKSEPNRFR